MVRNRDKRYVPSLEEIAELANKGRKAKEESFKRELARRNELFKKPYDVKMTISKELYDFIEERAKKEGIAPIEWILNELDRKYNQDKKRYRKKLLQKHNLTDLNSQFDNYLDQKFKERLKIEFRLQKTPSDTILNDILKKYKGQEFITIEFTLPPHLYKWVDIKSRLHRNKMIINEFIIHLIKVRKGYYDRAKRR